MQQLKSKVVLDLHKLLEPDSKLLFSSDYIEYKDEVEITYEVGIENHIDGFELFIKVPTQILNVDYVLKKPDMEPQNLKAQIKIENVHSVLYNGIEDLDKVIRPWSLSFEKPKWVLMFNAPEDGR